MRWKNSTQQQERHQVNTTERATRFALSGVLALVALLMDFIARDVKFDIAIHGASERVDNYAQFVSLTWIFVGLAVIAFGWSFEAILTRKKQAEDEEQFVLPENWQNDW